MVDVEPYVDMPYSEVQKLKKNLEKMGEKGSANQELLGSMNALTKNMDNMLNLFRTAAEEMKTEDNEEKVISKELGPITDRLDEIIEQNKIIAEGMVALADLVKERIPDKKTKEEDSEEESVPNPDEFNNPNLNVPPAPSPGGNMPRPGPRQMPQMQGFNNNPMGAPPQMNSNNQINNNKPMPPMDNKFPPPPNMPPPPPSMDNMNFPPMPNGKKKK